VRQLKVPVIVEHKLRVNGHMWTEYVAHSSQTAKLCSPAAATLSSWLTRFAAR
jgi:hypothetical protein